MFLIELFSSMIKKTTLSFILAILGCLVLEFLQLSSSTNASSSFCRKALMPAWVDFQDFPVVLQIDTYLLPWWPSQQGVSKWALPLLWWIVHELPNSCLGLGPHLQELCGWVVQHLCAWSHLFLLWPVHVWLVWCVFILWEFVQSPDCFLYCLQLILLRLEVEGLTEQFL